MSGVQERNSEELGSQEASRFGCWHPETEKPNSAPGMLTQAPLAPLGKEEEPDKMELMSQPHPV